MIGTVPNVEDRSQSFNFGNSEQTEQSLRDFEKDGAQQDDILKLYQERDRLSSTFIKIKKLLSETEKDVQFARAEKRVLVGKQRAPKFLLRSLR